MNWVVRNWLIVVGCLVALSLAGSYLAGSDFYPTGALLVTLAWVAVGLVALAEGTWRLLGRSSFLGPGQGLSRVVAVVQILLAFLLLFRLVSPSP